MHTPVGRLDAPAPLSSFAPPVADRPRRPRQSGGPEGPWWQRPVRPQ